MNMRAKIFLLLCFAFAGLAVRAVAQESYNFGWNTSAANAFQIKTAQGGNTFSVLKDASITFSVDKISSLSAPISFGVYTFDASNNVISLSVFDNLSAGDVFSVNFGQGDNVAFWLNVDGITTDTRAPGGGFYSGQMGDSQSFLAQFHVVDGDWSNYWNTVIRASGGAPVPQGTPLPGLISTLVLCCAGVGAALALRRRHA